MAFIYNLLDTWNNAGTVFSGIKLNVTNTASATGSKLIDLQIGGSTFFNVDKSGQVAFLAGTAAAPTIIPSGDLNTGMWFPAADTIAWSTGGSERMRIDSNGFVGIGTSTPNSPLTLVGNNQFSLGLIARTSSADTGLFNHPVAIFANTNSGAGNGLNIRYQIADNSGTLRSVAGVGTVATAKTASSVTGDMYFYVGASERMRIDSSGNVGIGTSSPTTLLSVNGIASFGAGAAATPSVAAFGDLDTGMWFPAANTLAWSTGGVERLRVASSGNVGIGTSSFGTSAATVFSIATGTAPTTGPADTIQIYSTDLSAGNTMLSLYTEGTVVNANTTTAATHRIAIRVNGTVYYLLANTAA